MTSRGDGISLAEESIDLSLWNHHAASDPPSSQDPLGKQVIHGPKADAQGVGSMAAAQSQNFLRHQGAPQILPLHDLTSPEIIEASTYFLPRNYAFWSSR
jgi:hypothetical protein